MIFDQYLTVLCKWYSVGNNYCATPIGSHVQFIYLIKSLFCVQLFCTFFQSKKSITVEDFLHVSSDFVLIITSYCY